MTGGSQHLRRFRIAMRDGATVENAAAIAGMGIDEARAWAKDDAENPPSAEAYELIGERPARSRVTVTQGDCVEVLRARTGPLFDAVICDPPYHLLSTVERFSKVARTESTMPKSAPHARMSRGFMGQTWDGGDVAFRPGTWRAIFDQMKPGAHLAAFSGTRTYHRMAVAIEDAGFEVRDQLAWIYGSGMPKSAGLKPAWEPICLARKPCEGTRKANIAAHGTGGLNIDPCRIGTESTRRDTGSAAIWGNAGRIIGGSDAGRWPANILHDDSDEVVAGFPSSDGQQGALRGTEPSGTFSRVAAGPQTRQPFSPRNDTGSAARFFYNAKAGPLDRLGSEHPTVKPVDLMRWLCRLITPAGGLILDPFAGSGTTGIAAIAEGFDAELIDMEADHIADIEAKLAHLRGDGARIVERHLKRKAERAKPTGGTLFD